MKSTQAVYTGFEFESEGHPALAIINSNLKDLENKTQYHHSVFIEIIPDRLTAEGHPAEEEYEYLIEIEKKMIDYLEGQTRTVHVGRTTVYRKQEFIFYTGEAEKVEGFLSIF